MAPQEVLNCFKAEPFRPFRIWMASGRTYEIRHPGMVRVTLTALVIFSSFSESPDIFDKWETASLGHIESISHLQAPAA